MLLVNLAQDKSSLNAYISNTLLSKIEENLKKDKKIILYINKR
jgi:primosomal protein N'